MTISSHESGLEVLDLRTDTAFASRALHPRDVNTQMAGLQRLSHALLEKPETILQELVQSAIDLCEADSAGISIVKDDGTEESFYHWVATAGNYSGFLDATLPRNPSACGICLERGHAQHFTVSPKFFEILGVEAPVVTDGILLPWSSGQTRGTIFIMAHDRTEAFDNNDVQLMNMLADFAAMGCKQQQQTAQFVARERAAAAAQMANQLAHEINNPLQSLTNAAYLVSEGATDQDYKSLGYALSHDLRRLSGLVQQLLSLPLENASRHNLL
jgi:hypothetical protein